MENAPIFDITPKILNLTAEICAKIGEYNAAKPLNVSPKLRKENRIRTIHSSLAIESNSLSLGQVTDILNGKRILGNPLEIAEIKNAADAYNLMFQLNPMNIDDLLKAHRLMMKDLITENGSFRNGNVGVFDGDCLIHAAPPAKFVPQLISDLFEWYKDSSLHPLVKSAAFHYEFEFIHPFSDGNGRMGRMWHTLLLGAWNEVFFWLPIEELIKERQEEYYSSLGRSDSSGSSTDFIEMMLEIIYDSLNAFGFIDQVSDQDNDQDSDQDTDQDSDQVGERDSDRVKALLLCMEEKPLSATEIMNRLGLAHKPSFRKNYLSPALKAGLVEMVFPDKPNSKNQKYRKK